VCQSDAGLRLGVGLDDSGLGRSPFFGYRLGYRSLGYQRISLGLDLFRQVALPSITLGALVDSAMRDAMLVSDLAQRLDCCPVVQLDALPVNLGLWGVGALPVLVAMPRSVPGYLRTSES